MNKELLEAKMKLLAAMYDDKDVWEDMDEFDDNFNNVFTGYNEDDVIYFTWDDQNDTFELSKVFDTIFNEIAEHQAQGKQLAATWNGYMGTDDILVLVIAFK